MVLFIRIKAYCWILPNKSQTKIVMSIYNTQKILFFPIFNCNIRYINFLENQQYLSFMSIIEKVVLVSFLQNKFYKAAFIFRIFMNFQGQNVINVKVTDVTNFSVESF